MPSRRPSRQTRRARHRRSAERTRRFAALALVSSVLLVTLVLTAFAGSRDNVSAIVAAPATPLLPSGPPEPTIVAVQGPLRLQLPVAQSHLTAIGYHAAGNGALALKPLGRQGNRSLPGRLVDRLFGGDTGGLVYYQLEGGQGPATSSLDVGAEPETDVFSPVDGTVVGITAFVLNRKPYGARIDIQPAAAPSLVVSVTRLRPDPVLTVGSTVSSAVSRIGSLLDLSDVERQALARYTQDAGNHVSIEVRPAATLVVP